MIIDRFEGDYAVAERDDGDITEIATALLPENAKEGDVIVFTYDGYIIDEDATAERRKATAERLKRLTGGV